MLELDPFTVFRTALFVALTLYYAITMGVMCFQGVRLLLGHDPRTRLVRAYLSYQLLTVRVRPLASELFQILVWTAVLFLLYGMHLWQ